MATTNEPRCALTKAPSRTIFRSMFKARWQNMQNIINDSAFIDMIPEPYLSYYIAYIRQWIQWSTGFVPMLHRQDFFATGMGYTVCDLFTRECMSGGYRIESTNQRLKAFMEEWGKDLGNVFNRMFFHSNAGGNAILCLTPIRGQLYPSVFPINRIFFQIGRRGEITEATILNRFTAGATAYYTREHRVMLDGVPYYKVELAKGTLATSPTWSNESLKAVPLKIASQWTYNYGDIEPGVWYKLPKTFKTLGLFNVRNKSVAVALADLPGYSDSTLHTALDVLYSIDYNYTQAQVDMYMGKSRALIPKQMQTAIVNPQAKSVVDGVSYADAVNQPQLNDEFYTQISTGSLNGEPVKPMFIQPDLRGEAHHYIRDSDLQLLASKIGMSSSDLANHLTYNSSKTATEVRAEQDTTETTVNNKRALANIAINAMFEEVARFYGYTDKVEIEWGRAGVNSSTENKELLEDFRSGTLPLREYLKRRWSDLSEEEIDSWVKDIEKQQKAQAFGGAMFDDKSYFGGE